MSLGRKEMNEPKGRRKNAVEIRWPETTGPVPWSGIELSPFRRRTHVSPSLREGPHRTHCSLLASARTAMQRETSRQRCYTSSTTGVQRVGARLCGSHSSKVLFHSLTGALIASAPCNIAPAATTPCATFFLATIKFSLSVAMATVDFNRL